MHPNDAVEHRLFSWSDVPTCLLGFAWRRCSALVRLLSDLVRRFQFAPLQKLAWKRALDEMAALAWSDRCLGTISAALARACLRS